MCAGSRRPCLWSTGSAHVSQGCVSQAAGSMFSQWRRFLAVSSLQLRQGGQYILPTLPFYRFSRASLRRNELKHRVQGYCTAVVAALEAHRHPRVFQGEPSTVNVLYNDALCIDNREVTTNFPGTVFLHWKSALCNSNDARCNDSQTWFDSLRLSLHHNSTTAVAGGNCAAQRDLFTLRIVQMTASLWSCV